jgi:uncharacterized protein (DUF3084 family)
LSQSPGPADSRSPAEPTRARVESRLAGLRNEYEKGQIQLQRVQAQLTELQQAILRLSGAITVLEELLTPPGANSSNSDQPHMSASPAPLSA